MRTIKEIHGNCRIDEGGHWIWTGAQWEGTPRIYAPDNRTGGQMLTQTGCRAVYQLMTGKPIPTGVRIFNTCGIALCVRPQCIRAGTAAAHGEAISKSGHLKSQRHRIEANRKNALVNRKVTPEIAEAIWASDEPQKQIAARLGLHEDTVGKVMRHEKPLLRQYAGMFAGLMR